MKTTTIFVDCFNTIIGRTKTPNDVLYDWATLMTSKYPEVSAKDFYQEFQSQWSQIARMDRVEKENSEFLSSIHEILDRVYFILKKYNLLKSSSKQDFVNFAFEKYFEAEKASHYLKRKTVNYLTKQKAKGKTIYVVSDFYCSKDTIADWLKALKFDISLIEDIFTSYDLNKSKNGGSIYSHLLKTLNLNPKQVKMVGDNLICDINIAKKNNLKTKWVFPQIKRDCKALRSIKHQLTIPQEYIDIFNEGLSDEGGMSYPNYAFPLYLFTKRLADACIRKNIKHLFFLAREGKFMKVLFDEYCKFNKLDITTHYYVVSRVSAINATILPYDTTFRGLINKPFLSPENFLKTLNFSKDEIKNILKDAKLKPKIFYLNFGKSKAYKKLINAPLFSSLYQAKRQEQHQHVNNYLNSFGVDLNKNNFVVVDSGWMGNMQRYIKNSLEDQSINTLGYYIGCFNKTAIQDKTYGALFVTHKRELTKYNKILAYRRFNYEEILRAPEATCVAYDKNGPVLADKSRETKGYETDIKPLQDKILEKFIKVMSADSKTYSPIESVCVHMFYKMIKETTKADNDFFIAAQDSFFDNFGYVTYSYRHFGRQLRRFNFWIKDKTFLNKYKKEINKKKTYFI